MERTEPRWITEARKDIGVKRYRGPQSNPKILQYWRDIKRSGIKDEMVPWCAAFTGAMLERTGIRSTRFESAASYLTWGEKLDAPEFGCIVVFTRTGGGHVGFVIGQRLNGDLIVLGGNQSDAVNVRSFPLSRVSGYRWPAGEPRLNLPLPTGDAAASTNEA